MSVGRRRALAATQAHSRIEDLKATVHAELLKQLGPQLYDANIDQDDLAARVRQVLKEVIGAQVTWRTSWSTSPRSRASRRRRARRRTARSRSPRPWTAIHVNVTEVSPTALAVGVPGVLGRVVSTGGVPPACSAAQLANQASAEFQLIATSLTEYASMWST